MNVAKLLSESWSFFKIHLIEFVILLFPFVVPLEILSSAYEFLVIDENSTFIDRITPYLFFFLIYSVCAIAMVFYIASIITNDTISISDAWRLGVKFWVPYMVMFVINMAIVLVGFTLLIIPGIYFALRLSFAPFELLLEGLKPIESLRSSWRLTKGHVGKILGGGVVIYFSFFIPFGVLGSFLDQSSFMYFVYYTIGGIFSSLVGALFTILIFRIYWLIGEQHNKSLNTDAGDAGAG